MSSLILKRYDGKNPGDVLQIILKVLLTCGAISRREEARSEVYILNIFLMYR